jgi:hypothetical protein
VLLQSKGQLHGGAQGVLPRHKIADYKKMCQRGLATKKEEEERDYWFSRLRPMTKPKQMWQEKW